MAELLQRPSLSIQVLRLPAGCRRALADAARLGYPHETCGLLIGSQAGRATIVRDVTRARNLAAGRLRDRYRLDPDDFVAADAAARAAGLDVVGVWHSHPDHPARPSPTDRDAAWEAFSYLILSVGAAGVADVRCFRLEGPELVEQPIEEVPR